ncbi:hypothetical protein WICPIJ_008105 [Wickerhamomyces pijperi]|uniref:Uncharacterized protein n=1 Tax=Wickerhamomyces pijperi TaxID=599730 RepID=A0A9P8PYE2_WICPI|nr:hypothetical protein WICPIJ_008105 [Wickerhamomyces pijperi]
MITSKMASLEPALERSCELVSDIFELCLLFLTLSSAEDLESSVSELEAEKSDIAFWNKLALDTLVTWGSMACGD